MGSSVTRGCPDVGQSGTGGCASDVGLKRPCPGSLLCKGALPLHPHRGTATSRGHPGRQPWSHLATTTSLQAPTLPCLAFAFKQDFGSCCQNPSALQQFPAAQVPARPRGSDIPLVASSCKAQSPTARAAGSSTPGALGKHGCEITPEKCRFLRLPSRFTDVFRAALRGHLECHPQPPAPGCDCGAPGVEFWAKGGNNIQPSVAMALTLPGSISAGH